MNCDNLLNYFLFVVFFLALVLLFVFVVFFIFSPTFSSGTNFSPTLGLFQEIYGSSEIIDVKGFKTKEYIAKKKVFEDKFDLKIKEV